MFRLLPISRSVMATEPAGDLRERLQQAGSGHLISGKIPKISMVILKF